MRSFIQDSRQYSFIQYIELQQPNLVKEKKIIADKLYKKLYTQQKSIHHIVDIIRLYKVIIEWLDISINKSATIDFEHLKLKGWLKSLCLSAQELRALHNKFESLNTLRCFYQRLSDLDNSCINNNKTALITQMNAFRHYVSETLLIVLQLHHAHESSDNITPHNTYNLLYATETLYAKITSIMLEDPYIECEKFKEKSHELSIMPIVSDYML